MVKAKKQSRTTIWELAGWAGVVFIAGSYSLLALGLVDGESPLYHSLVLAGSVFVAGISYLKKAYQPFVLNMLFALLAAFALVRIILW